MEKIKKELQEFREFVLRGNVLDLAVGVIIGGAFWGDKNLVHALDDVGITEFVKVMIAHSFGEYFLLQYGEEVRKMNLLLEFPLPLPCP